MPKQDESTEQQSSASTKPGEETQQTPESSTPGQSEPTEVDNSIPAKFVGKSAFEIAQNYRELERDRGRLANELGSTRKEREDLEKRFRDLEASVARYNTMPTQAPPTQQPQRQEVDPLEVFDKTFDEDPKKAFKDALRLQREVTEKMLSQQSYQARQQEAQQFYWTQKKDNPDYARREAAMQQLAQEFGDVIRPEFMNSKKVLEALDLMSRGRDVDYYSKQAVEKVQKNGSSVRMEKRRSQSESASSEGEQLKDFKSLSATEMAKLLGRSDD